MLWSYCRSAILFDFNFFFFLNVAIDNVKYQIDSMGSGETASDGPVLEEFIPLKPSLSSSDEESAHDLKKGSEKKADWLQSVQLWNQEPDASPPPPPVVKNHSLPSSFKAYLQSVQLCKILNLQSVVHLNYHII